MTHGGQSHPSECVPVQRSKGKASSVLGGERGHFLTKGRRRVGKVERTGEYAEEQTCPGIDASLAQLALMRKQEVRVQSKMWGPWRTPFMFIAQTPMM